MRPAIGDCINHRTLEITTRIFASGRIRKVLINLELALPHDAVATKTGILNQIRLLAVECLNFAGKLGKENRIAPCKSHRR